MAALSLQPHTGVVNELRDHPDSFLSHSEIGKEQRISTCTHQHAIPQIEAL